MFTKQRYSEAFKTLIYIAKSNKKPVDFLDISIDKVSVSKANTVEDNEPQTKEIESKKSIAEPSNEKNIPESTNSFVDTVRMFKNSRKLFIITIVNILNWITNTLVYYGISFNTGDLVGDPYLNFFLFGLVELFAIFVCQLTLDRFGRKLPYTVNMIIAGLALIFVSFVPNSK